jgi:hypothetical protein
VISDFIGDFIGDFVLQVEDVGPRPRLSTMGADGQH